MNDFFIFHFLFTVYYEKGNNYSYARLVKKPHRSSYLEGFHKTGVNENFPSESRFNKCFLWNTSGASEDRKSVSRFAV